MAPECGSVERALEKQPGDLVRLLAGQEKSLSDLPCPLL